MTTIFLINKDRTGGGRSSALHGHICITTMVQVLMTIRKLNCNNSNSSNRKVRKKNQFRQHTISERSRVSFSALMSSFTMLGFPVETLAHDNS